MLPAPFGGRLVSFCFRVLFVLHSPGSVQECPGAGRAICCVAMTLSEAQVERLGKELARGTKLIKLAQIIQAAYATIKRYSSRLKLGAPTALPPQRGRKPDIAKNDRAHRRIHAHLAEKPRSSVKECA